ncbi:hypothetical protein CBL_20539, partial [Carabus blaptoides fortunei]
MIPVNMLMFQALQHRELRVQHQVMRNGSDPFSLPEVRFKELFRLNQDMVRYLFQILVPQMRVSLKINYHVEVEEFKLTIAKGKKMNKEFPAEKLLDGVNSTKTRTTEPAQQTAWDDRNAK